MEIDAVASSRRRKRKRSKTVHFDESRNQIFVNNLESKESQETTWYTANEYKCMRDDMIGAVQELRKRDMGIRRRGGQEYSFSDILKTVFNFVSSIDYVVEDDPSTLLNDKVQQMLSQLYTRGQDSFNLIGLEKHLQCKLKRACKKHRENIHDAVSNIQREHLAGLWNDDVIHDELRDSCLAYSQAYGLLAQLAAFAQLQLE